MNITLASILTLVLYLLLYAIWFAILSKFDAEIALFLLASFTACAFGLMLVYTTKIKHFDIESEIKTDYTARSYLSIIDDFKLIIRRESSTLIYIAAIVTICFALNTFDSLVFDRKVISFPTIIFAPMCLFDTVIDLPFVGYAVSVVFDCTAYTVFLLLYRKKKYKNITKI